MNTYFYTVITMAKVFTKRYFRDKTALFFTILFPLILLVLFGSLFGNSAKLSINVALFNHSNTAYSKSFVKSLKNDNIFDINNVSSMATAEDEMGQGRLSGIIVLPSNFGDIQTPNVTAAAEIPSNATPSSVNPNSFLTYPTGTVQVYYDQNSAQAAQAIQAALNGYFDGVNAKLTKTTPPFTVETVSTAKKGDTGIDYIFSGIVGLTVIVLGLLGPSRSMPENKKQGILRRYHTTPVTVVQYVISLALSYVAIGFVAILILFLVAQHFYHFHMQGSYIDLIVFLAISIVMIFGFGLAIGGWAKDEQSAAPLTNLVSYPMMFLSGTFFPVYIMPLWLQNITHYIPLSPVIDGARLIMTENKSLTQLGSDIPIILVWLVIIYVIAFKIFRWES